MCWNFVSGAACCGDTDFGGFVYKFCVQICKNFFEVNHGCTLNTNIATIFVMLWITINAVELDLIGYLIATINYLIATVYCNNIRISYYNWLAYIFK